MRRRAFLTVLHCCCRCCLLSWRAPSLCVSGWEHIHWCAPTASDCTARAIVNPLQAVILQYMSATPVVAPAEQTATPCMPCHWQPLLETCWPLPLRPSTGIAPQHAPVPSGILGLRRHADTMPVLLAACKRHCHAMLQYWISSRAALLIQHYGTTGVVHCTALHCTALHCTALHC